jgi:hypothetical protein
MLTDGPLAPPEVCMLELLHADNAAPARTATIKPMVDSLRRIFELYR